jgi:hypothetical protein
MPTLSGGQQQTLHFHWGPAAPRDNEVDCSPDRFICRGSHGLAKRP